MRSEKEMMDLVLSLAEQDERIRIVTLEASPRIRWCWNTTGT